MEKDTKIILENMINARVGINNPELKVKRTWEKKGAKKPITWETLQELFYDPGVEYMLEQGILYVDNEEARIALGLQPSEDNPEATTVRKMDEAYLKRLMGAMPFDEFKIELANLTHEQIEMLVQYAIANECLDLSKTDELKKITGYDVVRAVQLNRQDKEE